MRLTTDHESNGARTLRELSSRPEFRWTWATHSKSAAGYFSAGAYPDFLLRGTCQDHGRGFP
jgi:hypothetical protein